MGERINSVMQTCFFAISKILPRDEAIEQIKKAIKKTYGNKGDDVVQKNYAAVDQTLANLVEVTVPGSVSSKISRPPVVSDKAPEFVKKVSSVIYAQLGDSCRSVPCRRRDLPDGYSSMGKAEHRFGNPGLGCVGLYPMREMRHGLSPRGHPHEGL